MNMKTETKNNYSTPEIEVIELNIEGCIAASNDLDDYPYNGIVND